MLPDSSDNYFISITVEDGYVDIKGKGKCGLKKSEAIKQKDVPRLIDEDDDFLKDLRVHLKWAFHVVNLDKHSLKPVIFWRTDSLSASDFNDSANLSETDSKCLLHDFIQPSMYNKIFLNSKSFKGIHEVKNQSISTSQRVLVYIVAPPHLSNQIHFIRKMWKRAEIFYNAIPAVTIQMNPEDFSFPRKNNKQISIIAKKRKESESSQEIPVCLKAALAGAQDEFRQPCLLLKCNALNVTYVTADCNGKAIEYGRDLSLQHKIYEDEDIERNKQAFHDASILSKTPIVSHRTRMNMIQYYLNQESFISTSNKDGPDTASLEALVETKEKMELIVSSWLDHLRQNPSKDHLEIQTLKLAVQNNKCIIIVNGPYAKIYVRILNSLSSLSNSFCNITKFPHLMHYGISSVLTKMMRSEVNDSDSDIKRTPYFGNTDEFKLTFDEFQSHNMKKFTEKLKAENGPEKDKNSFGASNNVNVNLGPGSLVMDLTDAADLEHDIEIPYKNLLESPSSIMPLSSNNKPAEQNKHNSENEMNKDRKASEVIGSGIHLPKEESLRPTPSIAPISSENKPTTRKIHNLAKEMNEERMTSKVLGDEIRLPNKESLRPSSSMAPIPSENERTKRKRQNSLKQMKNNGNFCEVDGLLDPPIISKVKEKKLPVSTMNSSQSQYPTTTPTVEPSVSKQAIPNNFQNTVFPPIAHNPYCFYPTPQYGYGMPMAYPFVPNQPYYGYLPPYPTSMYGYATPQHTQNLSKEVKHTQNGNVQSNEENEHSIAAKNK